MSYYTTFLVLVITNCVTASYCPTGGPIYARGLNDIDKKLVVDLHNKYRLDIANGLVANQPRGINLKRVQFDEVLAEKAKRVSNQCKESHVFASDYRWPWVGQNIYLEWSRMKGSAVANWEDALEFWFSENEDFVYPNKSLMGRKTSQYRQMVAALTSHVGCDYIYYYDNGRPLAPFTKLYTCNYGNRMNAKGTPYMTGPSGCENLC